MGFGENLKAARLRKKMTQAEVAELLSVAKSTYSLYETGRREPDVMKIKKLTEILEVSGNDLLGIPRSGKRVPVVADVAAGIPLSTWEDVIGWEEIESKAGDFFALRIKGDSMSPKIQDGDVVVVRSQPDAETGDIVIAKVNGDESCCKRLIKSADGITLQSLNPDYLPIYLSRTEIETQPVRILGKVIELRRKF